MLVFQQRGRAGCEFSSQHCDKDTEDVGSAVGKVQGHGDGSGGTNTAECGSAGTTGTQQHHAGGALPQSQAEAWVGALPSGGTDALPAAGPGFSGQE